MQKLFRDGVALAFEEGGAGEPPIVLIHGRSCDHTFMAPQFEHFSRKFRTIAVDLRGHGGSDKPVGDYTVRSFVEEIVWLCQEIDVEKPVVIGHSLGGAITLELAHQYPDLPRALVLLDAPVLVPVQREVIETLVEAFSGPQSRQAHHQFIESMFSKADDPKRKAAILDSMSSCPQHVMASAFKHFAAWDSVAAAKACKVPVLHISSERPLTDPVGFKELCPQLIHGQTVGASHFHQLEVPDQVNAMIDRFLQMF